MSANDALLIFLDHHNEFEGWLHLKDGEVSVRGADLADMPALVDPETGDALRVVAVVPGEAVSVHWLEVPPGLAPAQAIAAARLMAADVSVQPVADIHVAVGPEFEGESARAVALVPAITMAGWIGRLQGQGLDPDIVLPEPLLLPRPAEGFTRFDRGDVPLFRGCNEAFSVEPELAQLILGETHVVAMDIDTFEGGIAAALDGLPVNLRQGAFAKRRRWKIEWKLIRRLAMLALGILLVTLAIQVVSILRYTYAADALEAEASRVAGRGLPGVRVSNAPAQLDRRLQELGGSGVGYGDIAAALFGAVRDTPNVELTGMTYDGSGAMRATVQADGPATLAAFQQRVEASGFAVQASPLQTSGGRPVSELTVRPQ